LHNRHNSRSVSKTTIAHPIEDSAKDSSRRKLMETLNWMDMVLGGLAIAILAGGLLMLISGAWSARDK
jgi:hypothetical protein